MTTSISPSSSTTGSSSLLTIALFKIASVAVSLTITLNVNVTVSVPTGTDTFLQVNVLVVESYDTSPTFVALPSTYSIPACNLSDIVVVPAMFPLLLNVIV